jgi:quercetin dioxygenase-like cupin family protein
MRVVGFGPDIGWRIDAFASQGVTFTPLTEPDIARGAPFQAACMRLDPGGRIGRHPATVPQILAVVEGTGWVSGADGEPHAIAAGQAAYIEAGEEHETWTDDGCAAIVIESATLLPHEPRPLP